MAVAVSRTGAVAFLLMALAACSAATPIATTTASPTTTATPSPRIVANADNQGLRARAEAFAQAHTDARFEEMYESFTLESFREECDFFGFVGGLIGDAAFLRAFNGFGDDEPLEWRVRLVEVSEDSGSVVENVTATVGRDVGIDVRTWSRVDGEWFVDEPPAEVCNL